jgi:putative ABC transport system permease protein
MNLIRLSWKNLINKPLALLLSLVLFGLGVGLITMLLLLNKQLDDTFQKNLAGVDVVLGAKGSSLQIILCNMYHIDNPTGNIPLKTARPFLNPKHPIVDLAVPLSLGDSYRNYRIVGTLHEYLDSIYGVKVAKGKKWEKPLEVTVGAAVAKELDLHIGDAFFSSHGLADDGINVHDDGDPFRVVGILEESGSVVDQLILTSTLSIWAVHDHQGHDHGEEDHSHDGHDHGEDDHSHDGHDHGEDDHSHDGHDHEVAIKPAQDERSILMNSPKEEITSLLIRFKNNKSIPALNFARNINENTDMVAASPAYERARLSSMMGAGEQALRALALAIVIVSGLSVFISLYNSLRERKYELALIRVMGGSRFTLFNLITLEGILVAFLGALLGIILGHLGMEVLAGAMKDNYRYSFTGFLFLKEEFILLGGALIIGFVAAVIPALQAYRTQISRTLTDS